MGERMSVVLGGEASETAAVLLSAGFCGRDALLIYAFLKTLVPLVAVSAGLIRVFVTKDMDIGMLKPAGIVIAVALTLSKAVDFSWASGARNASR